MPQNTDPAAAGPAVPDAKVTDAKPVVAELAARDVPPRPGMIPVRLTIRPDADHWVMPGELPQLRHQGLLIEDTAPSGASAKAPASGTGKAAS